MTVLYKIEMRKPIICSSEHGRVLRGRRLYNLTPLSIFLTMKNSRGARSGGAAVFLKNYFALLVIGECLSSMLEKLLREPSCPPKPSSVI